MKHNFSFSVYYDLKTGITGAASYFGRGVCPSNPTRFVYLGTWQPSQNGTLPYVRGNKVYRDLRGKQVLQERLTKDLQQVMSLRKANK